MHPDKNAAPLAAEAFKRVQKAHETLSDAPRRRRYDLFGEEQPQRVPSPAGGFGGASPQGAIPGVLGLSLLALALSLLQLLAGQSDGRQRGGQWQGHGPKDRRSPKADAVVRLTPTNADAECGRVGSRFCVVLVQKVRRHGRDFSEAEKHEVGVLESLRKEVSDSVRNSRGQSLAFTWATAAATGRWPSLLPPGATLPWPVVLKASRAGLRAAAMPVPAGGGKKKRRLSEGVPRFLQEFAGGGVAFEPLAGNVSDLFEP